MRWSQPADRSVVEAVVATFREPTEVVRQQLGRLNQRQWNRSYYWLDANGIALYFLAELERLDLEREIPSAVSARLQTNRVDSRDRCASMSTEFVALNRAFQEANISYINLKGLSLVPDSCPDAALRCQLDFDFLVDRPDLETCRTLLAKRGYDLRSSGSTVWEFKTNCDQLPRIEELYKPRPQRVVELHFACDAENPYELTRDKRFERRRWRTIHGIPAPCLQPVDQLINQAEHLFHHLCGSSTRLAWVLEYKRHMEFHRKHDGFRDEVLIQAMSERKASIALGLATLISEEIFGVEVHPAMAASAIETLPVPVKLWAERYGRRAVLADSPGTKLYLFLKEQFCSSDVARQQRRRAVLPLHRAPRIVHVAPDASWWKRMRAELYQARFILFRIRFHVVEGVRFKLEDVRWKRFLSAKNVEQQPTHLPKSYVAHN